VLHNEDCLLEFCYRKKILNVVYDGLQE